MRRLLLVRHAPTAATRQYLFPADEPLDARGLRMAAELSVPQRAEVVCSAAVRCYQTAAAAGLSVDRIEAAIAECDFGSWRGRALDRLVAERPQQTKAWMTDPDSAPHGGESLSAFAARVGGWLDAEADRAGACVAITHGGVVKAAVMRALNAPIAAFWQIDCAPLSCTELHAHDGRWTVISVNVRLNGAQPATADR